MIKTQTAQSFDHFRLYALTLIILIIAAFTIAVLYNRQILFYLALSFFVSILYLIPVNFRVSNRVVSANLQIQSDQERNNLIQLEIDHEEKVLESLRGKIVNYSQLKGLTENLSMCLTLDDTSRTLSVEVNRLFGDIDSTIILYLFHSKTGELGLSSSQKGQMRVNIKAKQGDLFDQWIVKNMQPLFVQDAKSDFRFDSDMVRPVDAREIRSLISVPLVSNNKSLGILRVDHPQANFFTTEDLRFLRTIADLGSVAIENAQLHERIQQLAIHDSLTGLYLRRYFLERMAGEISLHLGNKKPLSLLMVDIDKFKPYNDRFGHVAGDIVLRTISRILTESFSQPGNLICRYGGEEFAVLLSDCTQGKAVDLAEKLRVRVENETIILRREKTSLTISVGVASLPKDARMREELILKSDQALYKAKETGRNKVCTV